MARVFENGINSSRKTTRRILETTALTAAGLALLSPTANAQDHAWSNFDTQAGSISTDLSTPNVTNITQHSDMYIGNSDNLDILSHQSVNIGQNSNSALFVARSTREGSDPTRILGALRANGEVMVLDRNGVIFGQNSIVDVGGIIVSTGEVSNEDILNGDGQYEFTNFGAGKIDLQGSISVSDAGLAGFVSPFVSNSGVINAKLGTVAMAGGDKVTLDLYGDNLVEIAVDDKAADALLENAGVINAEGGQVIMTAQAAKEVTDNIINVSGVINASSATVQGGKIVLGGGAQGKVEVSGKMEANGEGGGDIKVTGQNIHLTQTSELSADGVQNGNGGKVEVIADNAAVFHGSITARGGAESGNGGFVDTSAFGYLGLGGTVDTSAANGDFGTWLIDPLDFELRLGTGDTIGDGDVANLNTTWLPSGANGFADAISYIYESELEGQNTSFVLRAQRNFYVTGTSADATVQLQPGRSLTIETENAGGNAGSINLTGSTHGANLLFRTTGGGNITINGSTNGTATSNITLSRLQTENGNITIDTNNGDIDANGTITVSGTGMVSMTANHSAADDGDVRINAAVNTQAGSVDLTAEHDVYITGTGSITTQNGTVNLTGLAPTGESNVLIEGNVTSNGGDINATAGDDIRVRAVLNSAGTSGANPAGNITLRALGNNAVDPAEITISSTGRIVTTDNLAFGALEGNVWLEAEDIIIDTASGNKIDVTDDGVADGTITITRSTEGAIYLGSYVPAANRINMHLTQAELAAMEGQHLTIGAPDEVDNVVNAIYVSGVDNTANFSGLTTLNALGGGSTGILPPPVIGTELFDNNNVEFFGGTTNAFDALTINANDHILVFNGATITTNGDVDLNADTNAQGVGGLFVGDGALIDSTGDDITFDGNEVIIGNAVIDANGGNITLNNTGAFMSTSADTLRTENLGTITLNQWDIDYNNTYGGAPLVFTASIQNAVDAIENTGTGLNTIYIGDGTFNEAVTVAEDNFHLIGTGTTNTTIIDGTGLLGHGITVAGDNVTLEGMILENFTTTYLASGVYVNSSINNLTLIDILARDNKIGFQVDVGGSIDGLDIDDSGFNDNDYGLYTMKDMSVLNSPDTVTDVTVDNTTFNGNRFKGIYAEKLDNATFTNVDVIGSAYDVANVNANVAVEINLKNGAYENITFDDLTINSGSPTTSGNKAGVGISIKARNDGPSYDVKSATLTNAVIKNSNIDVTGGDIAVAISHAVDGATVQDSTLTGPQGVSVFRGASNITVEGNTINVAGTSVGTIDGSAVSVHGVSLTDAGGTNTVHDNTINGSGTGIGVQFINSEDITIDDNEIDDFEYGVFGNGSDDVTIDDNTITNVNFGIDIAGVTDSLTITDNDIDAFGGSTNDAPGGTPGVDTVGIRVANLDGATVQIGGGAGNFGAGSSDGNKIDDFETGISVSGGDDVTIDNNRITDARDYGIYVNDVDAKWFFGYFDGLNIVDNVIDGFYSGTEHGEGIHVQNSLNAQIGGTNDGNTISNTDLGIHVVNSESADVKHNTVLDIDGTGIYVQGSDWSEIMNNTITNVNGHGIHVNPSDYVDIAHNDIYDVEDDGIYVDGGNFVDIWDNDIDETDDDAIHINDNDYAEIWNNRINVNYGGANTESDGILVVDSHDVEIYDNRIDDVEDNAINLFNTDDVEVRDNVITDAHTGIRINDDGTDGADIDDNDIRGVEYGIYADDVANLNIEDNYIDARDGVGGKGEIGIYVNDSYNARIGGNNDGNEVEDFDTGIRVIDSESADIEHNEVSEFTDYGIWVTDSNWVDVTDNEIYDGEGTGIRVYSSDDAEINNNDIDDVEGHGIELVNSHRVDILDNDITNVDQHGIFVDPSDYVDIAYNNIYNVGWDGIHVDGGDYADIWSNYIDEVDDAIHINDNDYVEIWNNHINTLFGGANSGDDGILVVDSHDARIWNNEIDDTNDNAINLFNTDDVWVYNNEITDAHTGIRINDDGTDGADIDDNDIRDVEYGIYADDVANLNIEDNYIDARDGVGGKGEIGIYVNDSFDARIGGFDDGNFVEDFDTGIRVIDSASADVQSNDVNEFEDYGIWVTDSNYVDVKFNDVWDGNGTGIRVYSSDNAEINDNDIWDVDGHGIELINSHYVDIFDNDIEDVGQHGIFVDPSNYVDIAYNEIHNAGWDGIHLDDGIFGEIWDNHIGYTGDDGIDVNDNYRVEIRDNYIHNTDGHGIEVSNSWGADIIANDITGAGVDGINVSNSDFADISWNDIFAEGGNFWLGDFGQRGANRDGIHVENSDYVDIIGNDITGDLGYDFWWFGGSIDREGAGRDGIHVSGGRDANIRWNDIEGDSSFFDNVDSVGRDGIHVVNNFNADIMFNDIQRTGDDGIYAYNVDFGDIRWNDITRTGDDGIDVRNSSWVDVVGNDISRTDGDGVQVRNSFAADVLWNDIFFAGDDGIDVENSNFVDVIDNFVFGTDNNGIEVQNSDWADINDNVVLWAGENGIYVNPSDNVDIVNNYIRFARFDGIHVIGGQNLNVSDNTIRDTIFGDGIDIYGVTGFNLTNNDIEDAADNGIEVSNSTDGTIDLNEIDGSINTGIRVDDVDDVTLATNLITNSGVNGFWAAGGGNGDIILTGNTFTDNPIGALFESGQIDLTGTANTFNGGDVAMRFDLFDPLSPLSLRLVGDTIGSTIFNGQSTYYVELLNGALFDPGQPTIINGLNATYDGFRPADFGGILTQAQYDALEAMIWHNFDDPLVGLFFFGSVPNGINQEEVFRELTFGGAGISGLNVRIMGLPSIPGGPSTGAAFNNITPFAGGTNPADLNNIETAAGGDGAAPTAQQLNNIDTAAGDGQQVGCWTDAMNAAGSGQVVNLSYGGGGMDDILNGAAACGSSL